MRTCEASNTINAAPWQIQFLESLARRNLVALSVRGYRCDLAGFLGWYESHQGKPFALGALNQELLNAYRAHLLKEARLKASSINRRLQTIRQLCHWAVAKKHLPREWNATIERVRESRQRPVTRLTDGQIQALLRAAGSSPHQLASRNYALIQLLLQTGIRLAEVAALRVGDVELRERVGWVHVHESRRAVGRRVALNIKVRRALAEYLQSRGLMNREGPLFCSKRRGRLSIRGLQMALSEVGQRAQVNWKDPARALRDTFAIQYLRSHAGDYLALSKVLGQASLHSTRIYRRYLSASGKPSACPVSPAKFNER